MQQAMSLTQANVPQPEVSSADVLRGHRAERGACATTKGEAQRSTYKVVSLFSGAMGLDIGLERTGAFETKLCVESDRSCCATVRKNRAAGRTADPQLVVVEDDISSLDPAEVLKRASLEVKEIDLVAGGPPCQAFSVIGKRRGLEDLRGGLLLEFARFVGALRPPVFLMENVRGLLSMPLEPGAKKGTLFQKVQERFDALGYRTDCFVVNSVNYGAAQIRERVIVIGNRFNLVAEFPNPTHSDRPRDRLRPFITLGEVIRGRADRDPTIMDFSPRKKRYLALVPPGGNWRSMPVEIQKESMGKSYYLKGGRSAYWRKLSFEFPCPTVVTMPNHAGTSLCHPEQLRPLSAGECAQVQGFPYDWEFAGTASEKYKQVGNAVPVILGEVAGHAVAALLERIAGLGELAPVPLRPNRVVHLRPHVRTRWWWKDGEVINGLAYHLRPKREHRDSTQLVLLDSAT